MAAFPSTREVRVLRDWDNARLADVTIVGRAQISLADYPCLQPLDMAIYLGYVGPRDPLA